MLRDALSPLAEREFRLLFLARLTSFLGSAIAPVALAFAVIDDLDGSASELGIVLAAGFVPQVIFTLVGGVIADRLPRHHVLVGSDLASGAAQVVAAALLLAGEAELWHLAVLQVVRGAASSVFYPASTGLVPQTVPDRLLQQANALLRMTMNTSFVAGAAVGGVLVAVAGSGWALAFDGVTYFASAAFLLAMRVAGTVRVPATFVAELREGWTEFRSRQWLWVIVVAALVGNMCSSGARQVLGPVVADRALGGAAAWGTILAFQSAGLIVGGVVALRLRPSRPLLVGVLGLFLWGITIPALALELPVLVIAGLAVIGGIGVELFGVYWDTALQQHVPRHALSRVSSYDALGSIVAIPIGLAVAGPIADGIGVSTTLWVAFALMTAAVGGALLSRDVRTLPRREPEPEPA